MDSQIQPQTDGLSRCDECNKIVPHDKLRPMWLHGTCWYTCSFACAEIIATERSGGKKDGLDDNRPLEEMK